MNLEKHRELWSNVARKNGWYQEPFYVQVWIKNNKIVDSVSFVGLDRDIVEEAE